MARKNGSHASHVDLHGSHALLARMLYTLKKNWVQLYMKV